MRLLAVGSAAVATRLQAIDGRMLRLRQIYDDCSRQWLPAVVRLAIVKSLRWAVPSVFIA